MLKIRLRRRGKRNKPFFDIVVAEHSKPVKGKFIEKLGYYDPVKKNFSVNKERVDYWIEKGAQLSDTVHNLCVKNNIIKGKPIIKSSKAKAKKKEKEISKGLKEATQDSGEDVNKEATQESGQTQENAQKTDQAQELSQDSQKENSSEK